MQKIVQIHYQDFIEALEKVPNLNTMQVKNPAKVGELLKVAIARLKDHFTSEPFTGSYDEIHFFKYDKPKFYSEYIYALELFTIISNRPQGEEMILKNYYEQELRYIRRLFDQYRFLYQYYLLDGNELDHSYFMIGGGQRDLLLPEGCDTDRTFSSPAGFMFAKFQAMERLQNYLMSMIYPEAGNLTDRAKADGFQWTGDKTNLIEIAYGIYNTAQINNGDVNLADIVGWLESSFNVKLPRYLQMFSELKTRKNVSKTRYLDHMVKMIHRHIEIGDEFLPQKLRSVSGSKPAGKA